VVGRAVSLSRLLGHRPSQLGLTATEACDRIVIPTNFRLGPGVQILAPALLRLLQRDLAGLSMPEVVELVGKNGLVIWSRRWWMWCFPITPSVIEMVWAGLALAVQIVVHVGVHDSFRELPCDLVAPGGGCISVFVDFPASRIALRFGCVGGGVCR
jgi:hypothetical protein